MKSELSSSHFHNEDAAFAYVEAKLWPNGAVCPHCGVIGNSKRLVGKTTRPGLWKCYACRKQFTVRVGTIFESSHVPMHIWLQAFYLMCSSKKGVSARQLQRTFGGSMKTAWFLSHRIREAMKESDNSTPPMGGAGGTVEIDETFFGKKREKAPNERGFGHKHVIMSLVERRPEGARVMSFHVEGTASAILLPVIAAHVDAKSRIVTDEARQYGPIGRQFDTHESVNHSAEEYVRGDVHTNTVEGFYSVFKRGMIGIYQHCGEAHLSRYTAEFDFRYNTRVRLGIDDTMRTANAVKGAAGKRLTYRTTNRQMTV